MKQTELTGFVIMRKNINDADKIITILSKEQGRQSFIAKGIRKPRAKLQSHLEPLVETKYRILGNGKLPTLVGARGLFSNEFYGKTVDINVSGLLLTEIVEAFTVEAMPNRPAYDAYQASLATIACKPGISLSLSYYVLALMRAFGVEPDIEKGHTLYHLDINNGTLNNLVSADSSAVNLNIAKLWNACLRYDIETVLRLKIDKKTLADSLNLLLTYAQHHIERKLKSAKVLSESTNLLQAS